MSPLNNNVIYLIKSCVGLYLICYILNKLKVLWKLELMLKSFTAYGYIRKLNDKLHKERKLLASKHENIVGDLEEGKYVAVFINHEPTFCYIRCSRCCSYFIYSFFKMMQLVPIAVMWCHRNFATIRKKDLFPLRVHGNTLKMRTEISANFYQTTLVTFHTIIFKVT
jgi:hypothetical protein